jgi:hypothetical protein
VPGLYRVRHLRGAMEAHSAAAVTILAGGLITPEVAPVIVEEAEAVTTAVAPLFLTAATTILGLPLMRIRK